MTKTMNDYNNEMVLAEKNGFTTANEGNFFSSKLGSRVVPYRFEKIHFYGGLMKIEVVYVNMLSGTYETADLMDVLNLGIDWISKEEMLKLKEDFK